jgi:menaquinone-dependent protoporphyrinogen oxidase
MKLFIGYATTEGQTQKIVRHIADRLFDMGHMIELSPVADAETMDLTRFDGVILAGSLHSGHYQKALSGFAAQHADNLNDMPSLMISVSLAAAGHDADDWRTLDTILSEFGEATGWTPGDVAQVAGAYVPSRYDVFRRFIMRRIIAAKDPEVDLDSDREYTDWDRLDALVDGWLNNMSV